MRCITMSLTLHTTEIWLNTCTDSGGMKDRKQWNILVERVWKREHKHRATLYGSQYRNGFLVISKWPRRLVQRSHGDCMIYEEAPEVGGVVVSGAGTRCGPLPFSSGRVWLRGRGETGPVLLRGSSSSGCGSKPAPWHVCTGLSWRKVQPSPQAPSRSPYTRQADNLPSPDSHSQRNFPIPNTFSLPCI